MEKSEAADLTPSTVATLLRGNFDAIKVVLNELGGAVGADCTAISWFEPDEDHVRVMPCGLKELSRFEATPAMPGEAICVYPLMTGKPLAVSRFDEAPPGYLRCNFMVAEGLNSYLAHPVVGLRPEIRMQVCALNFEERAWTEDDIARAKLASQGIMLILAPAWDAPGRLQN